MTHEHWFKHLLRSLMWGMTLGALVGTIAYAAAIFVKGSADVERDLWMYGPKFWYGFVTGRGTGIGLKFGAAIGIFVWSATSSGRHEVRRSVAVAVVVGVVTTAVLLSAGCAGEARVSPASIAFLASGAAVAACVRLAELGRLRRRTITIAPKGERRRRRRRQA